MSLSGKVALVTGGSSSIGRAIAVQLASRGADVAIQFFRHRQAAAETQAEVEKLGVRCVSVKAQFKGPDEIAAVVEETNARLGGLDILINNAASTVFGPAMKIDAQAWDWTMNISACTPLRFIQQAAPLMEARGGGRVVNISSLGSSRTLSYYAMLGAAKAALEALTRYLSVELAPKGIIVNAVLPGSVVACDDDPHWRMHPDGAAVLDRVLRSTPLGRYITPLDVAKVVAFLASDDAQAIVGQTLVVDGGWSNTC